MMDAPAAGIRRGCDAEEKWGVPMKSWLMFLGACLAGVVLAPAAPRADEPVLRIAKQGSMEAGGKVIDCATNDGGDPNSKRWPPGHVVVDNVYATYQYPADR